MRATDRGSRLSRHRLLFSSIQPFRTDRGLLSLHDMAHSHRDYVALVRHLTEFRYKAVVLPGFETSCWKYPEKSHTRPLLWANTYQELWGKKMKRFIQNSQEVTDLVSVIKNAGRRKPICVVSIAASENVPGFDIEYLASETENMAEFYVMKTGDLTREFMAAMPENTQVYGGAARAYPTDFSTTKVAGQLRFPVPPQQLKKATAGLISDIWGYANAAGLIAKPSPNLKPETVTVQAIYGGATAVLRRSNGEFISLRAETVFPGISLERVLTIGQELQGIYDPNNKAFEFEKQNPTISDIVEHFGFGTATLGLIKATNRKSAIVALHPNLSFEVDKNEITGNDRDVISDYLQVGQAHPFRIYRDPQGRTRLQCLDIEDDEIIRPALSLVPGGEPWLEEGLGSVAEEQTEQVEDIEPSEIELPTDEVIEQELENAGQAELSKASKDDLKLLRDNDFLMAYYRSQVKIAAKRVAEANAIAQRAKDEADALAAERNSLARKYSELQAKHRELGFELSELKKDKRASFQRSGHNPWTTRSQFETPNEWLREEVRRAWIDTFKPNDRKTFDLEAVSWSFGERFFEGFDESSFDETKLRKVIRTIVELVSNRNAVPGGTESHPLTANFKGQIRREGSTQTSAGAMRMYVEEKTSQAMRLHYWKLDAGGYELSGVEIHDTFSMR